MAYVWHRVPCCRTTWNSKHQKNKNSSQESRLTVTYNIVDASEPILLYLYMVQEGAPFSIKGVDMFDKVEIDGTEVSVSSLDEAEGIYQLSTGEHTITYTLKDPTFIGAEIDEQTQIPTKIGALFSYCTSITSVQIPNSVTTIGDNAFIGCSNLTSIDIPNTVTSIGYEAFAECSSLTSVTIGNGITTIIGGVFINCSSLTSVTIGSGVISIGDSAFAGCSSLTSIDIPNGVTSIGVSTFLNCTSLTSITIPNSVTSIGNGAFKNCTSLTNVTIGSGVTRIGSGLTEVINGVFESCTSLTTITSLASIAPLISNNVFYNIKTNGTLYVPQGSSGYDTWMDTGNYYLGKYGWTKIEQ